MYIDVYDYVNYGDIQEELSNIGKGRMLFDKDTLLHMDYLKEEGVKIGNEKGSDFIKLIKDNFYGCSGRRDEDKSKRNYLWYQWKKEGRSYRDIIVATAKELPGELDKIVIERMKTDGDLKQNYTTGKGLIRESAEEILAKIGSSEELKERFRELKAEVLSCPRYVKDIIKSAVKRYKKGMLK